MHRIRCFGILCQTPLISKQFQTKPRILLVRSLLVCSYVSGFTGTAFNGQCEDMQKTSEEADHVVLTRLNLLELYISIVAKRTEQARASLKHLRRGHRLPKRLLPVPSPEHLLNQLMPLHAQLPIRIAALLALRIRLVDPPHILGRMRQPAHVILRQLQLLRTRLTKHLQLDADACVLDVEHASGVRDEDFALLAVDGPRQAFFAGEGFAAAQVVGDERAGGETPLQQDLVRRVFLDGLHDLAALLRIHELDGGPLVAEDAVEGVELTEGGEDEVDRYYRRPVSLEVLLSST